MCIISGWVRLGGRVGGGGVRIRIWRRCRAAVSN